MAKKNAVCENGVLQAVKTRGGEGLTILLINRPFHQAKQVIHVCNYSGNVQNGQEWTFQVWLMTCFGRVHYSAGRRK